MKRYESLHGKEKINTWAGGYIILATCCAFCCLKHNQARGERNGTGGGRKCLRSHGTAATVGKLVRCMWHSQCVNNSKREISLLLVITEMERTAAGTGVIWQRTRERCSQRGAKAMWSTASPRGARALNGAAVPSARPTPWDGGEEGAAAPGVPQHLGNQIPPKLNHPSLQAFFHANQISVKPILNSYLSLRSHRFPIFRSSFWVGFFWWSGGFLVVGFPCCCCCICLPFLMFLWFLLLLLFWGYFLLFFRNYPLKPKELPKSPTSFQGFSFHMHSIELWLNWKLY